MEKAVGMGNTHWYGVLRPKTHVSVSAVRERVQNPVTEFSLTGNGSPPPGASAESVKQKIFSGRVNGSSPYA